MATPELRAALDRVASAAQQTDAALSDALKSSYALIETAKESQVVLGDSIWNTFSLALNNSRPPKLRDAALNAVQRLIAHRLLHGTQILHDPIQLIPSTFPFPHIFDTLESQSHSPLPYTTTLIKTHRLIDDIIRSVTTASSPSNPHDDYLHIQILKTLLTAITSTDCKVHDTSLIVSLYTCFLIHSQSVKSSVNEVTSKASLTQMVNLVFSRMERYAGVVKRSREMGLAIPMRLTRHVVSPSASAAAEAENVAPGVEVVEGVSQVVSPEQVADSLDIPPTELPTELPLDQQESQQDSSNEKEHVQPIEDVAAEDAPQEQLPQQPSQEQLPQQPSQEQHSQEDDGEDNPYNPSVSFYNDLLRRDAYLTLRLLCIMSMHSDTPQSISSTMTSLSPTQGTSAQDDLSPSAIKTRILAMELLLSILNNAGPVITTDPTFIHVIRTSLCPSLSRNAVTPHPLLFELSISIFLLLLRHYRQHLKPEIEILLSTVYLQILDLGHSSYKHKTTVLQALIKITESPQLIVDLYVNYDCDLNAVSVFEKIMSVCTKLAQGKLDTPQSKHGSGSAFGLVGYAVGLDMKTDVVRDQERRLKVMGLCVLVSVIQSLCVWSRGDGNVLPGDVLPGRHIDIGSRPENVESVPEPGQIDGMGRSDSQATLDTIGNDGSPGRSNSPGVTSSANVDNGQSNVMSPMGTESSGAISTTSPTVPDDLIKPFMDALAPTSQSNPLVVNKNPLYLVSLDTVTSMPSVSVPTMVGGNTPVLGGSNTSVQSNTAVGQPSTHAHGTITPEPTISTTTNIVSTTTTTDPRSIEQAATRKQLYRRAIRLFNQHPNKGIKYLIDTQFITNDVENITEFLRTTSELSKSAIGDYLGDGNPFNIKVMHAFIDSLDFTGQPFVTSLRQFLQHFRLPGEAQKIDRIMEKYADRYCETNPTVFTKADTAYTLAFSVIMLNTDQHSSQIKHRMDKQAFIRNNRGINDDGNLADDYLGDIFDEISQNEIVMDDDDGVLTNGGGKNGNRLTQISMGWGAGDLNDKQRLDNYKREVTAIQKKSQMLMNAVTMSTRVMTPYRVAVGRELARPMFVMASWAVMATLSLVFESASDDGTGEVDFISRLSTLFTDIHNHGNMHEPKITDLCLRGFASSIRLACTFKLETERSAYVTSLTKLTCLTNMYTMKPKNMKSIRVLVDLSVELGEDMETSWVGIMKMVSQLERVQAVVMQSHNGEVVDLGGWTSDGKRMSVERTTSSQTNLTISSTNSSTNLQQQNLNRLDQTPRKISPVLETLVSELQSQTSLITIDKIFTKSVHLSATAIIHFFKAVCHVSLEEVGLDSHGKPITTGVHGPPRMYLLQKIVEIAYYNMHRIRYEWTQIWRILQPHFNTVSTHSNTRVSTFAVDSLRQLGMKFLEREELGHFSTQHEFLKSFEWIIRETRDRGIRELILSSMGQMVNARARSIRSGWKSIFVVLARCAQPVVGVEEAEGTATHSMAQSSFTILQMVFRSYFEDVVCAGGFVDLVSCLAEFALLKGVGPAHDELVMGSIQLLQSCVKSLIERAKDESSSANIANAKKKKNFATNSLQSSQTIPTTNLQTTSSTKTTNLQPHLQANSFANSLRINNLPQQPYLQLNGCISEEHFYLSWFPILSAFSRVIIESDGVLVRTHTLETLFETFRTSGGLFDPVYWRTIDRNIVSPIFDELMEGGNGSNENEETVSVGADANSAVLILGLRLLVEMLSVHFDMLLLGLPSLAVVALSPKETSTPTSIQTTLQETLATHGVSPGLEMMSHAIDRMLQMMGKKNDKLAATGQICLQQFLTNNVLRMSQYDSFGWIVDKLVQAFRITIPAELINCHVMEDVDREMDVPQRISSRTEAVGMDDIIVAAREVAGGIGSRIGLDELDFEHTIVKCVTHLDLLVTVREFCLSEGEQGAVIGQMGETEREKILTWVYSSYVIARAFNSQMGLRHAIWKRGWVSQLPNLVKQETVSFSSYLLLLFACYKALGDSFQVTCLATHSFDILSRFISLLNDPQKHSRDIALWSPTIILIYSQLLSIDSWWTHNPENIQHSIQTINLKKLLPKYFKLAIRIISVDRQDLRSVLQEFLERVGDQYVKIES